MLLLGLRRGDRSRYNSTGQAEHHDQQVVKELGMQQVFSSSLT